MRIDSGRGEKKRREIENENEEFSLKIIAPAILNWMSISMLTSFNL